jgi:hypothetical protein
MTGLQLQDAWTTNREQKIYTHYTTRGATRLDTIYMTPRPMDTKQGTETLLAAFTDHLRVMVRMQRPIGVITRRKPYFG